MCLGPSYLGVVFFSAYPFQSFSLYISPPILTGFYKVNWAIIVLLKRLRHNEAELGWSLSHSKTKENRKLETDSQSRKGEKTEGSQVYVARVKLHENNLIAYQSFLCFSHKFSSGFKAATCRCVPAGWTPRPCCLTTLTSHHPQQKYFFFFSKKKLHCAVYNLQEVCES